MLKFSVVLLGVERVIFFVLVIIVVIVLVLVVVFQRSSRRRLHQSHGGARDPDLVSSGTIPAPAKNIITRGKRGRHDDDILPQRSVPGHDLADWSPDASLGVGAPM